jgi:hypothetical protein
MRYRTPVRSLNQRSDQRGLVGFVQLDGAPIVMTARQIASLKSVMLNVGARPLDTEPSGEGSHDCTACSPPNGDDGLRAPSMIPHTEPLPGTCAG